MKANKSVIKEMARKSIIRILKQAVTAYALCYQVQDITMISRYSTMRR